MRNCFVPGCDAFCKKQNQVQRKMFLAPKNQVEAWSKVLHNKRDFKKHDRVCERHFNASDIVEFWESIIQGKLHLTPRDKPKLRENAIPSLNLPAKNEILKKPKEKLLERRNEKVKILSNKIIAPAKIKPKKTCEEDEKQIKTDDDPEIEVVPQPTPDEAVEMDVTDEIGKEINTLEMEFELDTTTDENVAIFENLYDEAFDVTLPSLLWGIHRDPERKFIVFSEFNPSLMSTAKLLHIASTLRCSNFINSKLHSSKKLKTDESATDQVSLILDELDKEPLS